MKTSCTITRRWFSPLYIIHFALAIGAVVPMALHAGNINWGTGTSGDWSAPENWQGGALPVVSDTVTINSGTLTIDVTATTAGATIGDTAGATATVTIGNGGYWQANGPVNTPTGTFTLGKSGTGFLTIESGGVLITSATVNDGIWNRLGDAEGSYGQVTVKSGGLWESGGIFVGGSGAGVISIETGGTLLIRNATAYVGRYDNSYGEIIVDGYLQTGANGTYYIPLGYSNGSTGVLTVGVTGTVKAAQLEIGRAAGATGTATIAGHYDATGGNTRVGVYGDGILIIERSGVLNMINNSSFILSSSNAATGTAWISGTVLNANTVYIGESSSANATLNIASTGYLYNTANSWFGRNASAATATNTANVDGYWYTGGYFRLAENGTSVLNIGPTGVVEVSSYSYIGANLGSSGTAIVEGTWKMGNNLHIGQASASGYLYIAPSGTVLVAGDTGAAGIRVTYSDYRSTAHVEVDGYLSSGVGYIIVAHYGNSYMKVGVTGTVRAGTYISIGQGDYHNNAAAPQDYKTAYSGTVDVEGYMQAGTQLQVANRLPGTLNIATTGTVIAGTYGIIGMGNDNSPSALGIVNVAGLLQIGTYLTNGNAGYGYLDIRDTGNVIVGGNYTQNARSTLVVELDSSRFADSVNPELTAPLLTANGAATLSGTLIANLSPSAAASIEYTGGGEGKASQLSGIPVLRANGGISGDFSTVEINGIIIPDDLPDYIRGGGLKVNEGGPIDTRYDVGYGLAWKSGAESAHGKFTVEGGKTFEVDVQLADRPGINFTYDGWDGKTLTKRGDGTLILSVGNTYSGVTTVESGTLRFAGPLQHTIGALVNNGVVDFYDTAAGGQRIGGYRTIQAASLAGNGAFRMGVDLATGASDRLVIDGDAFGTYRLLITGSAASKPKGDEPTPTLVSIGGVNGIDYTADGTILGSGTTIAFEGNFDYGVFKYEVQMRNNGTIVIVNTGLDPDIYEHIRGVPGAQSLLWFDQQDNINRRFGELRAPRPDGGGLDIWARGHAASATIGGGSTQMRKSDVDIRGAEIGSDYTWQLDDQRATLGIYLGIADASQDFKRLDNALSSSTGESDMLGIGIYGAWFSESGWFANATASMTQYKNNLDAVDGSNNSTTADYKDHGFGATAEFGRRFAIASNGWFVEPAVQGAVARLTRADYTLTNKVSDYELSVHGADATVTRMRGALRFGRAWQTEYVGWMEIAGRFGATRERSSGGEVNISNANRWRPNLDGTRYEAGVGFFWHFSDFGQIYFDYEYAAGDNFNKPWGISFGFRLSL